MSKKRLDKLNKRNDKNGTNVSAAKSTQKSSLALVSGIIFTVVVIVIIVAAVFSKNQSKEEVMQNWLKTAKKIAETTKNARALDRYQFLAENYMIGNPIDIKEKKIKFSFVRNGKLVDSTNAPKVPFKIIIVQEQKIFKFFKSRYPQFDVSQGFTIYDRENKVIIIEDSKQMSDTFKGLILLHEADHYIEDMGKSQKEMEGWEYMIASEVKTWKFEFDLVNAFLGEDYRKLVFTAANNISLQIPEDIRRSYADLKVIDTNNYNDYNQTLRRIYWETESEMEFEILKQTFALQAGMLAATKYGHQAPLWIYFFNFTLL
ncbi:MAG: hypothetical protein NT116_06650 [Candidatus Parcubacteria bacterium]|nr:hypothetical protein [Candidatus Parcubacteria bacterium]